MSETVAKVFDPASLKPGDEVGVTWMSWGGPVEIVSRVAAIEADGFIKVEGQELSFWPTDGREVEIIWEGVTMPSPNGTRLCAPSDEGRITTFRSNLGTQLDDLNDSLQGQIHHMSWEQLAHLEGIIKGLQTLPAPLVIEVPAINADFKPGENRL